MADCKPFIFFKICNENESYDKYLSKEMRFWRYKCCMWSHIFIMN